MEMFWLKMLKDKRGVNPLTLKLGVALAISFAGFLYSHFRTKRIGSAPSPRSPHSSSPSLGHKRTTSGLGSLPTTPTSGDAALIPQENIKETSHPKSSMDAPVGFRASNRESGDKDAFLLPEYNDLVVEEFDANSTNSGVSPKKDIDRAVALKIAVGKDTEKEIHNLRNMVHILRERERKLEMQLLEYYGLKEQETAVMELQNRIKINSVEAKLFTLKIESLQADKQRLEGQVADHAKVMAELESAKAKIKMLKRKIRLDEEHTKEHLSLLQNQVDVLQSQECDAAEKDADVERRLQRLNEIEGESAELRLANTRLQYENAELQRRFESTQIIATSVLPEAEELQEANEQFRTENEKLTKEIEQLQAIRCADVEELVYLRWVNACLRYEMRNYKAPPGKVIARDLSKTLSPRSEEKAKQLIIDYANSEGHGDKGILDFDSEYWSSSQDSSHAESVDLDEVSYATRSSSSSKSKFFSKLRKLVHGKGSPKHNRSSVDRSSTCYATTPGRRTSMSTSLFEELGTPSGSTPSSRQNSCAVGMDCTGLEHSNKPISRSQSFTRPSLDTQKARTLSLDNIRKGDDSRRNSDVGSPFFNKRLVLKSGDSEKYNQIDQDPETEKLELLKFAEALKSSALSPKQGGRSAHSSF